MAESVAVMVSPKVLIPWAKNPRVNDAAIDEVAASIKRFGFAAPILARKADRRIIAGHTRHLAALKLNLLKVPVRYLDLTETEADALALADNKLGEIAAWDDKKLAAILEELRVTDTDLLGLGFGDLDDIDKIIKDAAATIDGAGDDSSGPVAPDGTKKGSRTSFAPVIKYEIVFENSQQQDRWFEYLKALKLEHPDATSIAARLDIEVRQYLDNRGE